MPLVVAAIGVTGTLVGGVTGGLVTQRWADRREDRAWTREHERERERWLREDEARTFEHRREVGQSPPGHGHVGLKSYSPVVIMKALMSGRGPRSAGWLLASSRPQPTGEYDGQSYADDRRGPVSASGSWHAAIIVVLLNGALRNRRY